MKNRLLLLLPMALFTCFASADVVDPDGQDAWKTLTVNVTQLDSRTLPNSLCRGCGSENASIYIVFDREEATIYSSQVPSHGTVTKKLTIPRASNGRFKIVYYWPNGLGQRLFEGEIQEGEKIQDVSLKRIDINHMTVTRQDGSTYVTQEGSFELSSRRNQADTWVYRNPTGTGIDVPVGAKYTVSVEAKTEDGPDSYRKELDFTGL